MVADGDGSDGIVGARCIAVMVSSVAYLLDVVVVANIGRRGPDLASILLYPTQHTIFRPRPCPTFHQGPVSSSKPLRSSRCRRRRRRCCARRDDCCMLLPVPYVQMAPDFDHCIHGRLRGRLAPMSMRRILGRELVGVSWFRGH